MPTTEHPSPKIIEATTLKVSFSFKLFSLYFDPNKIPFIQLSILCLQGEGKEEEEKIDKEQGKEEEMEIEQELGTEEKEEKKDSPQRTKEK